MACRPTTMQDQYAVLARTADGKRAAIRVSPMQKQDDIGVLPFTADGYRTAVMFRPYGSCDVCITGTPQNFRLRWRNLIWCEVDGGPTENEFNTYLASGDVLASYITDDPFWPNCAWRYEGTGADQRIVYVVFLWLLDGIHARVWIEWNGHDAFKGPEGIGVCAHLSSGLTADCQDSSTWITRGCNNFYTHCSAGSQNCAYDGECEMGLPGDSWSW